MFLDVGLETGLRTEVVENILRFACTLGDTQVVKRLLTQGPDVKKLQGNEETLLHLAAGRGLKAITQMLMQHGAEVNALSLAQETPYHGAGELSFCDEWVSPLQVSFAGFFSLAWYRPGAEPPNYSAVIEVLMSSGANVEPLQQHRKEVFHLIFRYGSLRMLEFTSESGLVVVPRKKRKVYRQVLTTAFELPDEALFEKVQYLLCPHPTNDNHLENYGELLTAAVVHGSDKIVEMLLDIGPSAQELASITASLLSSTCSSRDYYDSGKTMRFSLKRLPPLEQETLGAVMELVVKEYRITKMDLLLRYAADRRRTGGSFILDIDRLLLLAMQTPIQKDYSDRCMWSPMQMVKLLLREGADPSIKDAEGVT